MRKEWGFLGGEVVIEQGVAGDYGELARFHYLAGRPATWAGVWRVVFVPRQGQKRLAAVGVLSWPTLACAARERWLGLDRLSPAERIAFVNAHLRTISRVIVHPQFRGIGFASALVRRMCDQCPTRYVEALGAMASAHPMFQQAGMIRVPTRRGEVAYFIREVASCQETMKPRRHRGTEANLQVCAARLGSIGEM